jgi:fatty acid desaturase
MREELLYAILGLLGLGLVNLLWGGLELGRFRREVKVIASTHELERFKRLAAHQMYAALAQIGLLGLPILVFFFGLARGDLHPPDVGYLIFPSLIVLVLAFLFKKVEGDVQRTAAADDLLSGQRDAVVRTWLKRPFPDW